MQLAIILEIKLQKYIFEQNIFSAAIMVFFKPVTMGMSMHMPRLNLVNIHNIKEAINIQLTLISENKYQIKIRQFFVLANYASILKLC